MNEQALLQRIILDPNIMSGKPVIRGTRLTVALVVEKLAYGATVADLMADYPFITEEDVRSTLLYAAKCLSREEVYAA
jgi:uncharacterized protein (DUF433 family)